MVQYIGFAAGALTVTSFLPQVLQAWRTKSVNDVSFAMMALLMTGAAAWIVYGVLTADAPVIVTNSLAITLQAAIMVAKVRFSTPRS
ncbi:MAG: SemiSWEET family sugar transporter [Gemmatimonadota bacterium]